MRMTQNYTNFSQKILRDSQRGIVVIKDYTSLNYTTILKISVG